MSFGTVLQNFAIPSHQRQFVRPSRGDEDAIRRVARRHAREGGGCDQHRWRHVGQYDARKCAEPVEPDFRTGVERKLRLCRQGCDFPRRDRRNDQPGSNPVRLPQLPSGRLSQGIPPAQSRLQRRYQVGSRPHSTTAQHPIPHLQERSGPSQGQLRLYPSAHRTRVRTGRRSLPPRHGVRSESDRRCRQCPC